MTLIIMICVRFSFCGFWLYCTKLSFLDDGDDEPLVEEAATEVVVSPSRRIRHYETPHRPDAGPTAPGSVLSDLGASPKSPVDENVTRRLDFPETATRTRRLTRAVQDDDEPVQTKVTRSAEAPASKKPRRLPRSSSNAESTRVRLTSIHLSSD